MSVNSSNIHKLLLRPLPSNTAHSADPLTGLERLDVIIKNLEQSQQDVKEQIVLQALVEKEQLDHAGLPSKDVNDTVERQPNLAAVRAKWKPLTEDEKPQDARATLEKSTDSLFVEQHSHTVLVKETTAKLEAYNRGTPAALERLYKIREEIRKERSGAGSGKVPTVASSPGAGSPSAPPTVVALPGYDASRDPRRRV